ncbi:receptor-like protein EIX1 [Lactuca sativa]|uniref:receptor-like protein EIX1 n=1 Tax=Lactuca sativa TaxID=4236 RepID=UPI001C68E47E|nr:receptor-like protein EIX1 [Lactuca sativa]
MNPCVFIVPPLLLLLLMTTTTSKLGGDDMMQCLDNERDALLLFKAPLQDPNGHLSTWRFDQLDCCKWSGVTCNNQTGHVTWLHIDSYGLVGEISHSLLNLTYLNHLDLSRNSFHGTIPTFIGSLRELIFLDLSYNSLYGTIPPEFGNLTNLQRLYLGSKGGFRVENLEWLFQLNHLEELDMDGISLAKQNHWVDVILSLRKLSSVSLDGCELSHVVYPYSSSFLNSSSSIESLFLGNNNLTSSMYCWLFPLASNKLRFLDLSSNRLDVMPKNLGINLCSLEILSLDNNSLVVEFPDFLNNLSGCASLSLKMLYAPRNQFTGSLSSEIQNFSSITSLDLSDNHLNGSISEKLWELPRLETLDVSFNNLRVPSTYHLSNLSYVKYIDLTSCKLLGSRFPKWIQTFKNLTFLDLSNTGISDTIPLEFWDMWPSQLQHLNLSSNNISGKVPDLSSNFAQSSVIDLSSNRFYGPIPNVPSALSTLSLSRNKFSGGIAFICQIVDGFLEFLDLSHNSLTGQLPDCLWLFK